MKENNKGFSLVELLVAVAILGIVAVTSSLSFSAVRRADVTKARQTVDSIMSQVRMNNMSKAESEYLYIYLYDDSYYYKISNEKKNSVTAIRAIAEDEEVLLCDASIEIYYGTESATQLNGSYFVISYEKSTGAFKCYDSSSSSTVIDIETIVFSRGGKECSLTLAPETGKHTKS